MHHSTQRHCVWDSSTACQWVFSIGKLLICPEGSELRRRFNLLLPSMKRVVFQLFLTRSERRSFSTSLVSFAATS